MQPLADIIEHLINIVFIADVSKEHLTDSLVSLSLHLHAVVSGHLKAFITG
jgi:hypothetical protein